MQVPPAYFLDAALQEEASTSIRILLMFSFASITQPALQAMRMLGPGEIKLSSLKELIKVFRYRNLRSGSVLKNNRREKNTPKKCTQHSRLN